MSEDEDALLDKCMQKFFPDVVREKELIATGKIVAIPRLRKMRKLAPVPELRKIVKKKRRVSYDLSWCTKCNRVTPTVQMVHLMTCGKCGDCR